MPILVEDQVGFRAMGNIFSCAVVLQYRLDKLDDSAFKTLTDYQSTTVSLLALMSAATGDEEDCSTDRIQTKREVLEGLMPALKGLMLSSQQS
nr:E3 UFM1-protein ligase 1 homolog [Ipomoea batatas]GME03516.1 E3 UFM1-protein ligase 1 homolog [Ipomoea batatas]